MSTPRPQFYQPKEKSPFGAQLHSVCEHLSIGLPSFTGKFIAASPEESLWRVNVSIPGRMVEPETDSIDFSLEAETWDIGKSMATHASLGRIREEYHRELKGTHFYALGRLGPEGEPIRTRDLDKVVQHIQDLEGQIRMLGDKLHYKVITNNNLWTAKA